MIFGLNKETVDAFILSLKKPENSKTKYPYPDGGFELTEEGDIESFLGVKIERIGCSIKISQPLLIERIIKALGFNPNEVNTKLTPSTHILHKDEDG